jgi:hypothetical protein
MEDMAVITDAEKKALLKSYEEFSKMNIGDNLRCGFSRMKSYLSYDDLETVFR